MIAGKYQIEAAGQLAGCFTSASAWRVSGTRCGVALLEPRCENFTPSMGWRSAGIVHCARMVSNSSQRAKRNSLERMNTNRVSSTAMRVSERPL